jgi:hypothetical protein
MRYVASQLVLKVVTYKDRYTVKVGGAGIAATAMTTGARASRPKRKIVSESGGD